MGRFSRFANTSLIRQDILEEHLEELETLLGQRDNALCSPDYDLADLARLENRINAHLDGLHVGGTHTIQLLEPELAADDVHRVIAAAAGLLGVETEQADACFFGALAEAPAPTLAGLVQGLCYLPLGEGSQRYLQQGLSGGSDSQQAAGWDALSFHRVDIDASISTAANHECVPVRRAAALAVGRLGKDAWMPYLEPLLDDEDMTVRQAAFMAAAVTGVPDPVDRLRRRCTEPTSADPWEIKLLGNLGDVSDVALLAGACTAPQTIEAGTYALAALGYVEAVPTLLSAMDKPWSAAAAGAAFTRITGMAFPVLEPPEMSDEEEEDTFADMRDVPDPGACVRMWADRHTEFRPDVRLRGGLEINSETWIADPGQGDLLSRRQEILRLRNQQPGLMTGLELDAPSTRQRAAVLEVGS